MSRPEERDPNSPLGEEPWADVDPLTAPAGELFVIQQHHATALHHDFRLEMTGEHGPVLVSWAVPKGLPRRKGQRHLAIRTPDHSMEHATFSGSIPEDEYGGGVVRIFDRGEYDIVGRTDDRITFSLRGERLDGTWHLVHTGPEKGRDQWLAMMSEDRRPAGDLPPLPDPMLATSAERAFDDPAWLFEPKWDGIRAIAHCDESTRLVSRNDHDITVAYPELHGLHNQVVALEAMLDGEIVAFEDGVPSFQRLQQRMHLRDERRIAQMSKTIPVVYMVFDILFLDGRSLIDLPLEERRRILEGIIVASDQIQVSPATEAAGVALFSAAADQGLEGVMAKRKSSRYVPGARTSDWRKVKVKFDADVVVVGWTEGEGRRSGTLGSLVMAVYDGDDLRYVGNVGTGFDKRSLPAAMGRLADLEESAPPVWSRQAGPGLRGVHWVSPTLVAMVEHRQLTAAGRLRAPSFKGFREDKDPKQCSWDQLAP